MSVILHGAIAHEGRIVIGKALVSLNAHAGVERYFINADHIQKHIELLYLARDAVLKEITCAKDNLTKEQFSAEESGAKQELMAMMDTHIMLLEDDAFVGSAAKWIRDRYYNAEWALVTHLDALVRQFEVMKDGYLSQRKQDVKQLIMRMLQYLQGSPHDADRAKLTQEKHSNSDSIILVTHDIAPFEMYQFRHGIFDGFVIEVGTRNSHTAIIARSLKIPLIFGVRNASSLIKNNELIILDQESGVILAQFDDIVRRQYQQRQAFCRANLKRRERELSMNNSKPSTTKDGVNIELLANIEILEEASVALKFGANGIGLFRSESLFMQHDKNMPDEQEQYLYYSALAQAMQGRDVAIRALDIGSDKFLSQRAYNNASFVDSKKNSMLGLRGIRLCLTEKKLFACQLRAILRASAHGSIKLLLPMVSNVEEIHLVQAMLDVAREQLSEQCLKFGLLRLGIMIEIPATAIAINTMLPFVDFVSIGTNDLIQYVLAVDRTNYRLEQFYNPLHPAVLMLLRQIVNDCQASGKPVSVCGEMASDEAYVHVLLGLGVRSFSMSPEYLHRVRAQISNADTIALQKKVNINLI